LKSNLKKAITGIGLNGSYQLITIIIGIIQVPIIISAYGNEGYGFFISFTIFNLLGYFAFADIGLPLFLQKDYFKLQNKKIGKFVVAATSLILLISSLLLVGVLFLLKDTIF
jgi:O-antigen/teichoic acid export membrane protein